MALEVAQAECFLKSISAEKGNWERSFYLQLNSSKGGLQIDEFIQQVSIKHLLYFTVTVLDSQDLGEQNQSPWFHWTFISEVGEIPG